MTVPLIEFQDVSFALGAATIIDGVSLGIAALANRRFTTLSQGEQQKVLLARALVAEPLMIILDEPCVGLDPGAREEFLGLLQRQLHADGGPTVVLVTHHVEEIVPDIGYVLVMQHGSIVAQGPTASCITPELMAGTYNCRPPRMEYRAGRFWPAW